MEVIGNEVRTYIPVASVPGAWLESSSSVAAGGGFEPPLPDPESGVLPLDDPAPLRIIPDRASKSRGELIASGLPTCRRAVAVG